MPLFDRYIAVDWSANNAPKVGADSIWACVGFRASGDLVSTNHATRRAAEASLLNELVGAVEGGERILLGLDFPYGYPAGFAAALGLNGTPWRAAWAYLTAGITNDAGNRSNRFDVGSDINLRLGRSAPFWGRPQHLPLPHLPVRKEVTYKDAHRLEGLSEWREVEQVLRARGAQPQPVWKLAYTGSVGSQTLLGIPVVKRLRDHPALRHVSRVWPFEVLVPDLHAGSPAVVHAEIWPSIVPFTHEQGCCNDERQVRAVVRTWRELDRNDRLAEWFAAARSETVRQEEGWVLGVLALGAVQTFRRPPRQPVSPAHATATRLPSTDTGASPAPAGRPPCLCGCGSYPRRASSRFMPGHDQRINPVTGRRFNDHHSRGRDDT
jgi:precorrin-8X/cobalt-precorrin-8 methylmutase